MFLCPTQLVNLSMLYLNCNAVGNNQNGVRNGKGTFVNLINFAETHRIVSKKAFPTPSNTSK
jgi:hypothetical protein